LILDESIDIMIQINKLQDGRLLLINKFNKLNLGISEELCIVLVSVALPK
jgi:hypothetical protein